MSVLTTCFCFIGSQPPRAWTPLGYRGDSPTVTAQEARVISKMDVDISVGIALRPLLSPKKDPSLLGLPEILTGAHIAESYASPIHIVDMLRLEHSCTSKTVF